VETGVRGDAAGDALMLTVRPELWGRERPSMNARASSSHGGLGTLWYIRPRMLALGRLKATFTPNETNHKGKNATQRPKKFNNISGTIAKVSVGLYADHKRTGKIVLVPWREKDKISSAQRRISRSYPW